MKQSPGLLAYYNGYCSWLFIWDTPLRRLKGAKQIPVTGHPLEVPLWVAMAEWLAHRTPNHKTMGSSPAKASWLIKNRPV